MSQSSCRLTSPSTPAAGVAASTTLHNREKSLVCFVDTRPRRKPPPCLFYIFQHLGISLAENGLRQKGTPWSHLQQHFLQAADTMSRVRRSTSCPPQMKNPTDLPADKKPQTSLHTPEPENCQCPEQCAASQGSRHSHFGLRRISKRISKH